MVIAAVIILLCITAIIFINFHWSKDETREHFLRRMEKLTEGTQELITGEENICRIYFSFEGENFIFEDREIKGLKETIQKAFLKAPTGSSLTMQFIEKKRKDTIRTSMIIASDIPNYVETNLKTVDVPESLSDFDIYTNNTEWANKLLMNQKVLSVFNKYKNINPYGAPVMSLKIMDGVILLEFHPIILMKPNLPSLKKDIHLLENYLDQIRIVLYEIKKLSA